MTAPVNHCCESMRYHATYACPDHPDRFECPDCLIDFSERDQTYGLILHDGGQSLIVIRFCPWCGRRLPDGTPTTSDDPPRAGGDAVR